MVSALKFETRLEGQRYITRCPGLTCPKCSSSAVEVNPAVQEPEHKGRWALGLFHPPHLSCCSCGKTSDLTRDQTVALAAHVYSNQGLVLGGHQVFGHVVQVGASVSLIRVGATHESCLHCRPGQFCDLGYQVCHMGACCDYDEKPGRRL